MSEVTTLCAHDAHDWQPIAGWYARYRCSICQVIGCKFGIVVARYRQRSTAIQPYRCEARVAGHRCNEPAVHGWYGKKFRCAAHHHPGRATVARKKLGKTDESVAPVPGHGLEATAGTPPRRP